MNMDKDEVLKELIKFKKESGWSYDRIARGMGVHTQTVTGWIQGRYKPSPLAMPKVEAFLKSHSRGRKRES